MMTKTGKPPGGKKGEPVKAPPHVADVTAAVDLLTSSAKEPQPAPPKRV